MIRLVSMLRTAGLMTLVVFAAGCASSETAAPEAPTPLGTEDYIDRVHGAWLSMMVANHSGLPIEGIWLDEPGPGDAVELVFLNEWSTDDDTSVEWLDLHIFEEFGINPTYEQIRDAWVDHLNGDIWVATLRARELMDEGRVPPETSDPALNPDAAWSMDAQLETELFGLISPGYPDEARRRAEYFALITNRGPAVQASAFYAHLISEAFYANADPGTTARLIGAARGAEGQESIIGPIVDDVVTWHAANPGDWRATRQLIADKYDDDPSWWASRVNFAVTIMALLYGDGDLRATLNIAGLAGWDADNNMTTSAGIIGTLLGYQQLPQEFQGASDLYFNEDLTGDLPSYDSVTAIAERTAAIGDLVLADITN